MDSNRFKTEIPSYQKEIKGEFEFNMGEWEKVDKLTELEEDKDKSDVFQSH